MLNVSSRIILLATILSLLGCSNETNKTVNTPSKVETNKTVNTPSKVETSEFIKSKLKKYVGVMNRKQEIFFDECRIKKVVGLSVTGSIDLKYFNPKHIEVQEGSVVFYTTGKQVTVNYNNGEHIDELPYFDFEVSSPEYNIDKVIKASKHLIKICGGKPELFE